MFPIRSWFIKGRGIPYKNVNIQCMAAYEQYFWIELIRFKEMFMKQQRKRKGWSNLMKLPNKYGCNSYISILHQIAIYDM